MTKDTYNIRHRHTIPTNRLIRIHMENLFLLFFWSVTFFHSALFSPLSSSFVYSVCIECYIPNVDFSFNMPYSICFTSETIHAQPYERFIRSYAIHYGHSWLKHWMVAAFLYQNWIIIMEQMKALNKNEIENDNQKLYLHQKSKQLLFFYFSDSISLTRSIHI